MAGRSLSAGMVFATLLAANIGAGSTVGATGLAYRYGLSAWWWSGSAALGCLVLGLVVAPKLHRLAAEHEFLTVGDFLEWRFDRSVRVLIAAVLWVGTLSLLAGQLLAMAWAFEVIAGTPRAVGALASAAIVVAYFGARRHAGGRVRQRVPARDDARRASRSRSRMRGRPVAVGRACAQRQAPNGGLLRERHRHGPGRHPGTGRGVRAVLHRLAGAEPEVLRGPLGRRAAGAAALGNAMALAVFAFVPVVFGMAMRAVEPGLANPELALPRLTTDVLPPWLGGLALAALFAAEISTADAVLFMLSTSLSRDLYQAVLRPKATDGELLRVGRLARGRGGALSVGLALTLPSVATALRLFYGVMTAALFVPLVVGLLSRRPGALHAKVAIVVSIATTLALVYLLSGRPEAEWLPSAAGILLAGLVFATAWFGKAPAREAGASIEGA